MLKRLVAVLGIAMALAACSRDLSAQSGQGAGAAGAASIVAADAGLAAGAAARTSAPGTAASSAETAMDPVVRALPDFSQLVEKCGPAVVNVEVVEKGSS